MDWMNRRKKQLKGLVRKHNRKPYRKAQINWASDDDDCLQGTLTCGDHELHLRLDPVRECQCCFEPLCECSLSGRFEAIEVPCDPVSIQRAFSATKLRLRTSIPAGKLCADAVVAVFPLWMGFSAMGLYEHWTQVVSEVATVRSELFAILGEQAAEAYKLSEQFNDHRQFWREKGPDTVSDDGFTPGERLFFALYPPRNRDREAAASWWTKLCDHRHWHEIDFVAAYVSKVLTNRRAMAA